MPLDAAKQVRALASPTDDLILSASRDSTAILWQKPNPAAPFEQERTFRPGSGYVNAVTIVPPTPDAPKGALLPFRPAETHAAEKRGGDPYVFLIDLACVQGMQSWLVKIWLSTSTDWIPHKKNRSIP
jgi:hypothetical protein